MKAQDDRSSIRLRLALKRLFLNGDVRIWKESFRRPGIGGQADGNWHLLRNCSGVGWDPGAGGEEFSEGVEGVFVVLDGGGEVGPDVQERFGTIVVAPAAGDLLLQFDHPDVPFGLVVIVMPISA